MKINQRKQIGKRLLSALFTTIMTITLFACIPAGDMQEVQAAATLSNPCRKNGVVTYDCIYFGNYPQSDDTGETTEPIKWRVLSVDGNDAFLVADQNLDTWRSSDMREWLNGYGDDYSRKNFIHHAFTSEEQEAILTTTVVNTDLWTGKGSETQDKIFLLSYDEVTNPAYGFSSSDTADEARIRTNTAYIAEAFLAGDNRHAAGEGDADTWWLRTRYRTNAVKCVTSKGAIGHTDYRNEILWDCWNPVCPALHLDLSYSEYWSYAETVSCNSVPSGIDATNLKLTGMSKKIAAGKKLALTPVFTPENATNKTLKWTSSNTEYATVNSNGVVTTKKEGAGKTVTITAVTQDGTNIAAAYKIDILKHAVKSIKLTAKNKTVKAGKKLKLMATVKTTGKTANKVLQWTSSNEAYATVTKKGVVKTKKAGKGKRVKITAKATDGTGKKASIKIKIK